ncbi:MAG: histidine triad nucleotide-binding protein [Ruminobacter sp.]|nr:histidine triad nucleotide-binding protein [Ruminobacter sp.]
MAEETIFSKIIRKEIPADIRYQDDDVTVFADIAPKAKVHLLIVPNKVIPSVNEIEDADVLVMGKLLLTAKRMAKELGIAENGYRLIINCGKDGGQEVPHLHMHLLGGEHLPIRGFGF